MKNKRQEKFDRLMEQLKKDEFKYVPREEKEIDWSKYDRAQINEINDMLLLMKDAVDEASLRLGIDGMLNKGPGRPQNHPADLAKAVLMQHYFSVSNRVAEGLVRLFMEKMGIKNAFSYKTIERAYEDPLVTLILREIFKMTQEPVRDKEHVFSPDGTGLSMSMKQNWENECRKDGEKRGYEKMIAMVGGTFKIFSAFELAENPQAHESPYFEPLLAETASCYERIDLVPADSAYLSRHNCDLIAGVDAIPRIYPKQGITLKRRGSKAWTEMLLSFIEDPQEWLREYHPRSISETAFSVFKRDFPLPLRKRIKLRRKQEAFTRACDYNLKRLCYLKYLEEISAVEVWNA
ncbi:MAG: transposase [Candidatus Hydrothermarchaeaceae archaeon]